MKLHFVKCNPTENMTILVMDPVPENRRPEIAAHMMQPTHLYAEQVGFVESPRLAGSKASLRLQMMGGELCVNALRSLAAVMAYKEYPGEPEAGNGICFELESSGLEKPISCWVFPGEKPNTFLSETALPLPLLIESHAIEYEESHIEGTLVAFPGICHLVVDANDIKDQESFFSSVIRQLDYRQDQALGIMFYHESQNYLEPLVWVRQTDSLVWERGCGSGTAAVGAAMAIRKKQKINQEIRQPGGLLAVTCGWESIKGLTALSLSGEIQIVAEGTAFL